MKLVPLAVALGLLLTGCTGHDAVSTQGNQTGFIAGSGQVRLVAPAQRRPLPDISGQLLAGGDYAVTPQRGHVVVINFFASWCPPCRAEANALEGVHQATAAQGVRFVGVDVQDFKSTAQAFTRTHSTTYPVVFDQPGLMRLQFRGLPSNAIPTTIVLDAQGREAARISGETSYNGLLEVIHHVTGSAA